MEGGEDERRKEGWRDGVREREKEGRRDGECDVEKVRTHKDLRVYQRSFELAMRIFEISKGFPAEEKYSLIDQIRRSSRSVSANIAEAFRSRRYPKAFISKLGNAECEAAETQVWLDFALACKYLDQPTHEELYLEYDHILGMLVKMILNPNDWCFDI